MSGGPLHRQLTTWRVQAKETIGGGAQSRSQNLGNLFPEMTAHLFRCIMFVGSKSLGPAHTQGQWIIQKHGSQEAEIGGATVKGCAPHPASSSTPASLLFKHRRQAFVPAGPQPGTRLPHGSLTSLKSWLRHHLSSEALSDGPISKTLRHSPSSLFPLYFFSTALTTF